MTPVTQRVEGYPHGECVRASYASLLDLPLHLVPRLDPGSLRVGESQRDRQDAWLSLIGLALIEVSPEQADAVPPTLLGCDHLITGISPRGFGHCCVGHGGRVLWDPHPSRAGLVSVATLGFVVPRC